jgi:hypothetical protein
LYVHNWDWGAGNTPILTEMEFNLVTWNSALAQHTIVLSYGDCRSLVGRGVRNVQVIRGIFSYQRKVLMEFMAIEFDNSDHPTSF